MLSEKIMNWKQNMMQISRKYFLVSVFSQEQFNKILEEMFVQEYTNNNPKQMEFFLRSFFPNLKKERIDSFNQSMNNLKPDFLIDFAQKMEHHFPIQESIQERIFPIQLSNGEIPKETADQFNSIFYNNNTKKQAPLIQFYKFVQKIEVYEVVTSLYLGYCNHFPLKETVLICDPKNTTKQDIERYFVVYQIYNQTQSLLNIFNKSPDLPQIPKYFFSILNPQNLSQKCMNQLLYQLKNMNNFNKFPLVIFFCSQNETEFPLLQHFPNSVIQSEIPIFAQKQMEAALKSKNSNFYNQTTLFTSHFSGMGKSFQIHRDFYEKETKTNDIFYCNIKIKEETTTEIIDKIYSFLQNINFQAVFRYLHIELPYEPKQEVMDYLWSLVMWNSIENKRSLCDNQICLFDQNYYLSFEIPSIKKSKMDNRIINFPMLKYFNKFNCTVSPNQYSFNRYDTMSKILIDPNEDKDGKGVFRLIELSKNNFEELTKYIDIQKKKEVIAANPNQEVFKTVKKKLSRKFSNETITFRFMSNFQNIMKLQFDALWNAKILNSTSIAITFGGDRNAAEKIVHKFFELYFDSMCEIISRSFKWCPIKKRNKKKKKKKKEEKREREKEIKKQERKRKVTRRGRK
eukprot:Anaeramoba_ignava/a480836_26.p1 GENE.a480836_26~~a480836_26.p1  ORF type:complete len:711 (-),score=211.35 a480836_26:21-1901(-)